MSSRRRSTFWRYNLVLEVSALILTAVILLLAVGFTLAEMNRKYLDLRLADAARVDLFLASHLDRARADLAAFADLSEQERSPAVLRLFSAFSDLYRLDPQRRVAYIDRATPGSKVFVGFSFSGGKLADALGSIGDRADFSEIIRGYEDDAPSVYFALRRGGALYLGRLNLAYIQTFLTDFSRFAGTPALLVANNGFVMLSGDPALHIPTFDLKQWAGPPAVSRTLAAGQRDWIPIVSEKGAIGARLVTLIPTELLASQRNALLVFLILFMGGLILLAVLKNYRMRRLIAQPMAAFAGKMRDLEIGRWSSAGAQSDYPFEELADIDNRFRTMAEAIGQRERSLEETTAQLVAANAAKSEFLAHMSHEIRTPMNAVLGLAQVLNREPLTANQRDMVGRIQDAGQSLLGIINDVLDLSKIEAGQLRIESRPFDLGVVLAKVDSILGETANAKGLRLRVDPPAASWRWLVGDGLRLEQVLFNLIGNALKFTERGGVTVRVEVRETSETTVRLRIEVRDTGIGIVPADLARLFTPFTQAEAGTTRRYGGTGLGLSICKRLVESMGGAIGAESRVEEGSTFWFELTFQRAAEDAVATSIRPPSASRAGPRLAGVRVLVVDDSAINRDLMEQALGLEGATVTLAADGQQAVEQLKGRPTAFDAVLMDVQMPVLDGLSATRLIRAELGLTELPIIACTAGVLPEQQAAARAAGANDVLAKPVDLEQLAAMLLTWVKPKAAALQPPLPSPPPPGGKALETSPPHREEEADDFPAIPGIDRGRAVQTLGRDRVFFLRLLTGFVAEFADAVGQTRRDLERGEWETAIRRIHTLRGNAGHLGALDLLATAGALEEAMQRGEVDLAAGLEALGRQLAALAAASAPWLSAVDGVPHARAEEAPPLDPAQLDALRADLRKNNLKARRRFAALQPALTGVLGTAATAALGRAIQGLRFEEALDILATAQKSQ